MTEWKAGMLARCVKRGVWKHGLTGRPSKYKCPSFGEIRRVDRVDTDPLGELTLWLEGYNYGPKFEHGFRACRFVSVRPSAITHIEALKTLPLPVPEKELVGCLSNMGGSVDRG